MQRTFKLWCERPLPPRYLPLLESAAQMATESAGAHAIIASAYVRYNAEFFSRTPHLRVISRTGIGYDNITLPDATARGIAVCNAPDGPTVSTAEHAWALLLAVTKRLKPAARKLKRGERGDFFGVHDAVELAGKTLGVVGAGRIGRKMAQMASGFGVRVIVFDPYVCCEGFQQAATLEELLRASNFISLHLPLTKATYHLIDADKLQLLPHGAFLINTARGGLVDEEALRRALESGHLLGAGLDVFEHEPPPPDHAMLNRDDVIATPHIATATAEAKDRLWRTAITQALQVLRGERPVHLVNPEVWK